MNLHLLRVGFPITVIHAIWIAKYNKILHSEEYHSQNHSCNQSGVGHDVRT